MNIRLTYFIALGLALAATDGSGLAVRVGAMEPVAPGGTETGAPAGAAHALTARMADRPRATIAARRGREDTGTSGGR